MRQSIDVGSVGRAYIVWQDWRAWATGGVAEIYFMQINPSLDDQNGDAADPLVIKTVDDRALTPDDGVKSFLPFCRLSPDDGRIRVTWHEITKGKLHYMVVSTNGTVVANLGRLSIWSLTYTLWTNAHIAFGSKPRVVWPDSRNGYAQIMMFSPEVEVPPSPVGDGDGAGCLIATAAYGSPMEPHVKVLREFRDRFLLTSPEGKAFVDLYYAYSPPVADLIAKHGALRAVVRWSLMPLVGVSWTALNLGSLPTLALVVLLPALMIATTTVFFRKVRL